MFYIRKPTKPNTISILREATTVELHNYKNRFSIVPPAEEPEQEVNSECGCAHHNHCFDEMSFININCDLDLDNLGAKD